MNEELPTPRTDAEELDLTTHAAIEGVFPNRRKVTKYVPSRLARELERELAAAREDRRILTKLIDDELNRGTDQTRTLPDRLTAFGHIATILHARLRAKS